MTLLNPHDRFFKEIFSRQDAAQDFLRHYLPGELVDLIDLPSLEISKDGFIDPELQEHFSDLLYKVALQEGSESFIYILFEHKSYPDPLIAFQLLRYMVRIWEQSLKQQVHLLPIIPLVIYHGQQRWRVALEFAALFDLPELVRPFVPDYRYWLCDLSQYQDEEIRGEVILRVSLLLLKYIFRPELRERLGDILGLLNQLLEQQTGLAYLETILRYLTGGTDRISEEELKEVVTELFEEGETLMPTIAEKWIEQGREEGLAQGLEKGRREAALDLLRRFLARRFGTKLDQFDQQLQQLDLAAITQLSDAAFEAKTLAEVEAALAALAARPPDEGTKATNGN
jgi:predicted transposase/invertase (TIGR01784 family)